MGHSGTYLTVIGDMRKRGYVYKHEIFHERNITMKIIELIRKIIFENVFMNAFFQMFYENVGC